jgi:hypothetical protein
MNPIVLVLAGCLISGPGAPYAAIAQQLALAHGEQRVQTEYLHRRAITELWLNPESGSFTILEHVHVRWNRSRSG